MKKLFEGIGIVSLVCISFLYTEKTVNVVKEYDEIMIAIKEENTYNFTFREVNYTKNSMELLFEEIINAIDAEKRVIIIGGNEENSKKVSLLLLENEISHKYIEKLDKQIETGKVIVTKGLLSTGFESFDMNLIVISGEELFNKETKKRKRGRTHKRNVKFR